MAEYSITWDEPPCTFIHFYQQVCFYCATLYYISEDSNYVQ